jgi:hypothetical protein
METGSGVTSDQAVLYALGPERSSGLEQSTLLVVSDRSS